jgi:hypothetical protein
VGHGEAGSAPWGGGCMMSNNRKAHSDIEISMGLKAARNCPRRRSATPAIRWWRRHTPRPIFQGLRSVPCWVIPRFTPPVLLEPGLQFACLPQCDSLETCTFFFVV